MFSRELNNANTVKRMADFLGHHLRIMKKIILILAAMLTFAACTKEGDVIYQTDPADALGMLKAKGKNVYAFDVYEEFLDELIAGNADVTSGRRNDIGGRDGRRQHQRRRPGI